MFAACDSMFLLPCLHMKEAPVTSLQIFTKGKYKISEHQILLSE